jgi:hypothetical protein
MIRGGAPPWRGYHYSQDRTLTIQGPLSTWEGLFDQLKRNLDPTSIYDLSFEFYEQQYNSRQVLSVTDKSVETILLNPAIRFRVYKPMARGMDDIGTFEVASSSIVDCCLNTATNPVDILSLKTLSLNASSSFSSSFASK